MKKGFVRIFIGCFALGLGFGVASNNVAFSGIPSSYRVAVVDIAKIVANSSSVKALKEEQARNKDELEKFVKLAKADVDKQSDVYKKKILTDKYDKELNTRHKNMQLSYKQKLQKIETGIYSVIEQRAKFDGYDLVLSKGSVLYGGTDITSSISQYVR